MQSVHLSAHATIRPAAADEAGVLAGLHGQCFHRGWTPDEMSALLKGMRTLTLVAEFGAEPVAFVLARAPAVDAEVISIATGHAFRRRGLAGQLLHQLHDRLTAWRCASVFLEVDENNVGAVTLYNGHGYRRVGLRRDYYKLHGGRRSNALILRKLLGPSVLT